VDALALYSIPAIRSFRLATLMPATNLSAWAPPLTPWVALGRRCIPPSSAAMAVCATLQRLQHRLPAQHLCRRNEAMRWPCPAPLQWVPPRSLEQFPTEPSQPHVPRGEPLAIRPQLGPGGSGRYITIEKVMNPRPKRPLNRRRSARCTNNYGPVMAWWGSASRWDFLQLSNKTAPPSGGDCIEATHFSGLSGSSQA